MGCLRTLWNLSDVGIRVESEGTCSKEGLEAREAVSIQSMPSSYKDWAEGSPFRVLKTKRTKAYVPSDQMDTLRFSSSQTRVRANCQWEGKRDLRTDRSFKIFVLNGVFRNKPGVKTTGGRKLFNKLIRRITFTRIVSFI